MVSGEQVSGEQVSGERVSGERVSGEQESGGGISVVIPAKDAATTIGDCLRALRTQTFDPASFEVIVVDDGSHDETAAIARELGARVVSIANGGPAVARNRGVEAASGEVIVFTDADCAPDPDFLAEILRPFSDPGVVATKGIYRSEQTSLTARFVQAEYESRYRRMRAYDSIDFVDTYAAAYRRLDLEATGGFDESFPLPSVEDQELSFRLAARGVRMVFCPRAVVRHRHADRVSAYFRKKLKIAYWKMRVLARYPQKAVSDSHTPGVLKAQILLAALLLPALAIGAVGISWWPFLAALGTFAACILPFAVELLKKDAALGLSAPFFLLLRAFALGAGMLLAMARGRSRDVPVLAGLRPRGETAGAAVEAAWRSETRALCHERRSRSPEHV